MSSPLPNESFLQWDPAQVSSYINSILPSDQKSSGSAFLDNNIEGSLLPFLTTEHLREIGFTSLHTRLLIKKAFSDLIVKQYQANPPQSINDPEYKLSNVNINSNYVSLESLTLSTILVQEMFKKMSVLVQQQVVSQQQSQQQQQQLQSSQSQSRALDGSPVSPIRSMEYKKLQDNFTKLKTDLIPVIRLLKDSKPLPTPTLDPGPVATNVGSPTFSLTSAHSESSYWNDPISEYQNQGTRNRSNSGNNQTNEPALLNSVSANNVSSKNASSNNVQKISLSNNGSKNASSNNVSSKNIQVTSANTSNTNVNLSSSSANRSTSNSTSPTYQKRFSSGSALQLGNTSTGKIIQQSLPKLGETRGQAEFTLAKVIPAKGSQEGATTATTATAAISRPRLTAVKSSSSLKANSGGLQPLTASNGGSTIANNLNHSHSSQDMNNQSNKPSLKSHASTPTFNSNYGNKDDGGSPKQQRAQSQSQVQQLQHLQSQQQQSQQQQQQSQQSQQSQSQATASNSASEPLKQLRASTEDSCVKILQQAMKRHHIPRDDWSKYVLVICYGDKERILKLEEKPVIIFKELQELGKHPAIMLRQLANDIEAETGSGSQQYENSRIGDDIPGGTL